MISRQIEKPQTKMRHNYRDNHGVISMTPCAPPDDRRATSRRAPKGPHRETAHAPQREPQTGPLPPHRSTPQEARPAPHPRRRRRPDHNSSSYVASRTPAAARTTDGIDESPAPERNRPDHRHRAHSTVLSNARSEGYNRIVKHVGRIAFGFRSPENQRRRVRWACTRQSRRAPSRTRLRPC